MTALMYIAYGSNCNPAVMTKKGVEFTAKARSMLSGYRLLFKKMALRERLRHGIGFPNINEYAAESWQPNEWRRVASLELSARHPA